MAGINVKVITNEVALAAATAKTVLQILAPTNQRLIVDQIGLFFDGIVASNEPVIIEMNRQTTAGTMSTLTPVKADPLGSETLQGTALHTATSEPTSGTKIDAWEVHPQVGVEILLPFGKEIIVPGGGRLGLICTAPQAVNVLAKMGYEE